MLIVVNCVFTILSQNFKAFLKYTYALSSYIHIILSVKWYWYTYNAHGNHAVIVVFDLEEHIIL